MNAVEGKEAKAGKRAGNYGVCKAKWFKCFPYPQKRKFLSAEAFWRGIVEQLGVEKLAENTRPPELLEDLVPDRRIPKDTIETSARDRMERRSLEEGHDEYEMVD